MTMLEEYDWWLINELSFKIHTMPDTVEMRRTVLEWLNKIIDFDSASFYLCSYTEEALHESSPVFYNFDENSLSLYMETGQEVDFTKWLFYNRKPSAYREEDLVSEEKFKTSPIYKQFYEPSSINHVCRMFLIYKSELSGVITLYRKSPSGDFSDRDLYVLNQLQDHLAYRLLNDMELRNSGLMSNAKCRKAIAKYGLTDREAEIFLLTISGMDNIAIAEKLCISPNTLKKHFSGIYRKTNVSSRIQLIQASNAL